MTSHHYFTSLTSASRDGPSLNSALVSGRKLNKMPFENIVNITLTALSLVCILIPLMHFNRLVKR